MTAREPSTFSVITPATFGARQRLGFRLALGLTGLRVALAGPLLALAVARGPGGAVAAVLVIGFLSDVYDGVIARRFDAVTPDLRRLDSTADTIFYLAVAICLWRLDRAAVASNAWMIAVVFSTQAINHLIEFLKFRKEASYHAWSAKAWGLGLFIATVVLFATGNSTLLPFALAIGLGSHAENFAITMILPHWEHDV
ncbi:MAG TPA: CDP-alcohol phosphatidyltransferase family protein, partial [Gemmatimonadaceae bacterium]